MSAQASPKSIPPTGLTVVVPHPEPAVDIVFLHGFTGHPERTWTYKNGDSKSANGGAGDNNGRSQPQAKRRRLLTFSSTRQDEDRNRSPVYWPRDLLPQSFQDARVLTYGYDTNIRHRSVGPIARSTVRDIAWDFLVALEADDGRREAPRRPLLFIVHSLGGIIVKELLRRSSTCGRGQEHLRRVFESTKGIMFFGTPHEGSDPLGVLLHPIKLLAKAIGYNVDDKIVNHLLPSSERLRELRLDFGPLAQEQRWIIHSFQEHIGLPALNGDKVVEDTSSILNIPAIEIHEHIGRDHMDMCRFSGLEDVEYKKVVAALRRIMSSLTKEQAAPPSCKLTTEQRQKLRDSLAFDRIDARRQGIKPAHSKTCKWLRKKDEYIAWLDPEMLPEHHGFLWIKGKPGAGKSTLMKFALAQAQRTMKNRIILSFFFHARGDTLEKSTTGMYRSLLLQLLQNLPELEVVFDSLHSASLADSQVEWSVGLLKDLLEQAVQSLGRSQVVFFIDALDECDEDQIRDMVSFFERIGEVAAASDIKILICFSSRHYPYITVTRGLELVLEGGEGHEQDIANYIDSDLKIGHSKVEEDIRAELRDKASGVFMWVCLVVDILNKEFDRGRIHALRKRLREIPADLHELFRDILTRDGRDRDELILCIQWVLFAKRPLRPEELYFAVLAESDPESLEPWDQDLRTLNAIERFIVDSSKGLVETTKSKKAVVQFIHESVRDFLLKDNGILKLWPDLRDSFQGLSHERLKKCCLKYIWPDITAALHLPELLPKAFSEEAAELRDRTEQSYPFLEYAVRNVWHHADQAEAGGLPQADFLDGFPVQTWLKLNNLVEKNEVRRYIAGPKLLYILAETNSAHLIRADSSKVSPLEWSMERYRNPFLAAVATQSTDAILALASREVEKSMEDSTFLRLCRRFLEDPTQIPKLNRKHFPLGEHSARTISLHGDMKTLHLLFATGMADFRFSFLSRRPVEELTMSQRLYSVHTSNIDSKTREEMTVALLVSLCSNIQWGQITLSLVVTYGNKTVVRLLLETGIINADSKDGSGRTLLSWAASKGSTDIVKPLLDTGNANINSEDKSGLTPLSWAAGGGSIDITRLLLDTGKADVNSRDVNGRTPLSWAAGNGKIDTARLLLDTGDANINSRDNKGRTPLSWAARTGRADVVRLLLDTGDANVDSRDNKGRTPLSWAVRTGRADILRLLLDTGDANVDSRDNYRRTPLSWAAEIGRIDIVRLLLDTGDADVDSRDDDGRTPLSWAAEVGGTDVARLLLDTGNANINSRDNKGRTPLSWAARTGRTDIVRLLLDTGDANVNPRDDNGRTPFSWTMGLGHDEVVDLLRRAGATL